ncbi:DUF190 domain-containing protein [Fusibacter paucivorans]|uniref:DUF190 domain-containing protein n=1 Tax=Fusibacter paucivorans TaxID=76009 RepID=A0ABS5PN21_9FIRM|nr:DUF190 domain-containing protein [Fusibacter paucivorans]MBS7526267.1 DUF190 domain-containing protein [Fusibacter paucivorans]
MNFNEKCRILKVYISEDSKYQGHNLYHAIVQKMHEMDMAGVTVTRGIEGYGQGKRIHSARVLELSLKLPVIVEIIDTVNKIEQAIPVLENMVNEGLILTTEVDVIKYGKESKHAEP